MSGTPPNRLMLTFESPDTPAKFFLRGYSGREGVSELFEYELDLLLPAGESVAFERLLGRPATVIVERGGRSGRVINGILCELEEVADGVAFTAYRAKLVPSVWRQTLNRNSRIFQQISVPDVLKQLFPPSVVEFRLRSAYDPHNFCVQYQESDFAFASRVMEEEGIFYFFEHERSNHKMIIADDSTTIGLARAAAVQFDPVAGGTRAEDRIFQWAKRQRLGATRFRASDHQFQLPRENFSGALEKLEGKNVAAGTVRHSLSTSLNEEIEIFDHTPGFSHCYDGIGESGSDQQADLAKTYEESKRVAALRLQEMASQSVRIQCQSDCAEVGSGSRFELKGHPNADGAYFVLRVEHDVVQASPSAENEERGHFVNRLTCQPADVPFRPSLSTAKPSARAQSAVVVGPAGEEIFTDSYGRVKVQFHWDRHHQKDPKSSCWLRVVQPWAGSGFGHISIPRVGQEVVVDFFHGDPDMPFVVGSVHNPDEPTPRPLPDCRSQTVFKSRTKFGAANEFNGFGMDDTPNSEHLQLQAQKYMTTNVKDLAYSNYGSGHHEMHGSVYSKRVGGLPFIDYQQTTGSSPGGSGTGATSQSSDGPNCDFIPGSGFGGEESVTSPNSGPFQWKAKAMGSWADDLEFTLGRKSDGVLGLSTAVTLGTKSNSVINPIGIAWGFAGGDTKAAADGTMAPVGKFSAGWAFITGMPVAGNTAAILGTSTTLIYGPSIKVTRGHNIDKKFSLTTDKNTVWTKQAWMTTAAASFYAIFRLVEQFNFYANASMDAQNIMGGVYAVVELLALDIWATLEATGGPVAVANKAAKEAQEVAANALANNKAIQEQAKAAMNNVRQEVQQTWSQLGAIVVANPTAKELEKDKNGASEHKLIDGEYRIEAGIIKIYNQPADDAPNQGVYIDSMSKNGCIQLTTKNAIRCVAGKSAGVLIEENNAAGNIVLDCSSNGSIVLQSGNMLPPNVLEMSPKGVIGKSDTMFNFWVDKKHQILIDQDGLTLTSFGGDNQILMNESSIVLERGSNSIQIKDTGIVIIAKNFTVVSSGDVNLKGDAATWQATGIDLKAPSVKTSAPQIQFGAN